MRTCAIESHLALISIWAAMRGWYAAISIRWIFFNRILFRYILTAHKSRWLQLSRLIWYAHPIFFPLHVRRPQMKLYLRTYSKHSNWNPNQIKRIQNENCRFHKEFQKRELPMSFVDGWSASNGSQCERARLRHHFITIYTYFFAFLYFYVENAFWRTK